MDIEDTRPVTELSEEDRRARRRQLSQQAIATAMQSLWEEAADLNREIVELMPSDSEAFNRLGKALTEIGQIAEAREAYEGALKADPANMIARRNLERLSRISDREVAELARKERIKLDPRFFTEEIGKTAVTSLQEPADASVLATLSAGEQVKMERKDGQLLVATMGGVELGVVDDRIATRLLRLMQTGNEYGAGVVGVDDHTVRVILRETHQAPQNAGRISFPPQVQSLPRPYLKEGLLRRSSTLRDEDDDLEIDVNDLDQDDDEEEENPAAFGFHESSLEES
ncbi:MAG: hypothetical protein ACRDFS_07785 [Chloroflexota bacterium]